MNTKGVEDGIEGKHTLQSSVSSGAVDPDKRWAKVKCACGESWKADGAGSLAWVNTQFYEHLNARQAVAFKPSAAVPVEERTAEIEQLMGRLREAIERYRALFVQGWDMRDSGELRAFHAIATPQQILTILDHIEPKPKLSTESIQEVQE
jgi:hypothetical protein